MKLIVISAGLAGAMGALAKQPGQTPSFFQTMTFLMRIGHFPTQSLWTRRKPASGWREAIPVHTGRLA